MQFEAQGALRDGFALQILCHGHDCRIIDGSQKLLHTNVSGKYRFSFLKIQIFFHEVQISFCEVQILLSQSTDFTSFPKVR